MHAPPSNESTRRGCLLRLGTRVGLFLVLFPFALVANVTEDLGGIWAWFGLIGELLGADGRLPAAEGGLVFLVAVLILIAAWAFGIVFSLFKLAVQSLLAVVVALLQTAVLVYVGGALLDVYRLRGAVARDDPRYVRKWGARGAVLAVAIWLWVVLLVPALSRLGEHPTEIPTAGAALAALVWVGLLGVSAFRLVGRLRRKPPAA